MGFAKQEEKHLYSRCKCIYMYHFPPLGTLGWKCEEKNELNVEHTVGLPETSGDVM